jgi:hypothetical protein
MRKHNHLRVDASQLLEHITIWFKIVICLHFRRRLGARMAVKAEYLNVVRKLLRTRTVVLLEDLLRAPKRGSAVIVFHVLKVIQGC